MSEGRFAGCLFGSAIGDALGFPTEFLSLDEIRARYGPQGVADFESCGGLPPGSYSDDTQMTLAVARGLLAARHCLDDAERVIESICREFVVWLDTEALAVPRAPGNTCLRGCRALKRGASWRDSGVVLSKGCGAAMRSAPIGLVYHDQPELLREVAYGASISTHAHNAGIASGIATAYLTALALHGESDVMIGRLLDFVGDLSEEFNAKVRQVEEVLARDPDDAFAVLGEGWVGDEAVADALYCFLRSPDDYRRTVLTGANTQGDSDSIACIAGAVSGAYNGIAGLPAAWVATVENHELLATTARHLADVEESPS